MSPKTKVQIEQIRELSKNKILDAALVLFANRGYDGTSISQIASEAEVSKGLIYNYFQSKEHLVETLIAGIVEKFMSRFPMGKGVRNVEDLEEYVDISFDIILDDLQHSKLFMSLFFQPHIMELVQEKMMEKVIPFMVTVTKFFKEMGFENPDATTQYFVATLDGLQMHLLVNPDLDLGAIKKMIIQQFGQTQLKWQ